MADDITSTDFEGYYWRRCHTIPTAWYHTKAFRFAFSDNICRDRGVLSVTMSRHNPSNPDGPLLTVTRTVTLEGPDTVAKPGTDMDSIHKIKLDFCDGEDGFDATEPVTPQRPDSEP